MQLHANPDIEDPTVETCFGLAIQEDGSTSKGIRAIRDVEPMFRNEENLFCQQRTVLPQDVAYRMSVASTDEGYFAEVERRAVDSQAAAPRVEEVHEYAHDVPAQIAASYRRTFGTSTSEGEADVPAQIAARRPLSLGAQKESEDPVEERGAVVDTSQAVAPSVEEVHDEKYTHDVPARIAESPLAEYHEEIRLAEYPVGAAPSMEEVPSPESVVRSPESLLDNDSGVERDLEEEMARSDGLMARSRLDSHTHSFSDWNVPEEFSTKRVVFLRHGESEWNQVRFFSFCMRQKFTTTTTQGHNLLYTLVHYTH